jgi:hypothetical protein
MIPWNDFKIYILAKFITFEQQKIEFYLGLNF